MENKVIKKINKLAIICILIFSIAISPKTLQNDTYYTIKNGEHIVQSKSVDMHDPFSWHDLKYTYPHWMYDTGIYLIYHLGENVAIHFNGDVEFGGLTAIYISTILLAFILGILIYFINSKLNKNYFLSLFISILSLYLLKDFIAARAQLVSYSLFILEIFFIEKLLQTNKKRYVIGLFILAVLIANLHAAVWYMFYILFLPYIGEFVMIKIMESNIECKISRMQLKRKFNKINLKLKNEKNENKKNKYINTLEKLREEIDKNEILMNKIDASVKKIEENPYKIKVERRNNIKTLIVTFIICFASGLLTPQTSFEPYTHMIKLLHGNTTGYIMEHKPIILINSVETISVLIVLFSVLIFTDTKITFKDLFMLGGLFLLTLMSERQKSMFVLIGGLSINRIIYDFISKYDNTNIRKFINEFTAKPIGKTLIIMLIISISLTIIKPKIQAEYINNASYPVEASNFILNNLDIENIKLFNFYNFGSYLLYRGIPVFIDSRCDLYSPEFNEKDIFLDAIKIEGLDLDYEEKFNEYGVTHIITYSNGCKLKLVLSKDEKYKIIYEDDNFCIFERLNLNNEIDETV